MPQGWLDLLPGCSGKACSNWLQARDDEFDSGVEWRHWARSTAGGTPPGVQDPRDVTTVRRRKLPDEQPKLIAPYLSIGEYGPALSGCGIG